MDGMSTKVFQRIVLLLVIVINVLVAINAIFHNPFAGYDSDAHLDYMTVAADHLPTKSDSLEYYSPPLPYYLPSIVYHLCNRDGISCKYSAGKFAQGINLILSILLTVFLLKIAELIKPGNQYFKIGLLILLSLLTVYYKTFSQVRGEPYLAFFEVLSIYLVLKLVRTPETIRRIDVILLGICLGGLGLSRQWGLFLFPAVGLLVVFLFYQNKNSSWNFAKAIIASFVLAFLLCGWFYIHLYNRYGSFSAFEIHPQRFSFSNQPPSFYKNTGLSSFLLFRSPTRKIFDNQLIPVFYSETWGDYWGYFTFVRELPDFDYVSNQEQINSYLGRVNLVSLLPSFIFLAGLLFGLRSIFRSLRAASSNFEEMAFAFLCLIVVISFAGYFWFLIRYPFPPKGTTIKATYMIQIFMALPFLGANIIESLRAKRQQLYMICMALLVLVFLHNVPAFVTRYW